MFGFKRRPRCGTCKTAMVPVVYGFPTAGTFKKAEQGKVMLGGCCIPVDGRNRWDCYTCSDDSPGWEPVDPSSE